MSDRQQRRAEILGRLSAGKLTIQEAAQLLKVTERQVRRLRVRFGAEGLPSVVHQNAGRTPANKIGPDVTCRIVEVAGPNGPYHDFNTCHLLEMLAEREQILIGRSTLDRLLKEQGVRKRSRSRPRRLFSRRDRSLAAGFMLLTDGSPHDWLEKRGPRLCLIGALDDATGQILHLCFWPTECLAGYLLMARQVVMRWGIPQSFYHDKHTILTSPKEATLEEELAGKEPQSQFEAVLGALGIEGIKAHTPQAKGRIERLWKTLQDRLRKELRLACVTSLEGANAFLTDFIDRYNARFAQEPKDPEPAWVKPDRPLDGAFYFAAKEGRVVRADHTLSYAGQVLQIQRKKGEPSLAGKRVNVHTTPEGERFVYLGPQRLAYEAVQPTPKPKPIPPPAPEASKEEPTTRSKPTDQEGPRKWLFARGG